MNLMCESPRNMRASRPSSFLQVGTAIYVILFLDLVERLSWPIVCKLFITIKRSVYTCGASVDGNGMFLYDYPNLNAALERTISMLGVPATRYGFEDLFIGPDPQVPEKLGRLYAFLGAGARGNC